MHFVSFAFIVLLFVSLLLRLTIGRKGRESPYLFTLLLLSLVFYGWHIPWYLILLAVSTVVDYFVGLKLENEKVDQRRKYLLWCSLAVNLGMLAVFKYYNFGVEMLRDVTGRPLPYGELALPMGISFYTFQSMSYTIDIYRRSLKPISSFWRFFLFVSFFPQLVAGPIVRAKEFLYQLDRKRQVHWAVVTDGLFLIVQGFFFKMVLADNFARVVDKYWPQIGLHEKSSVAALVLALIFSAQIFCDFAGYSRIARGVGYLLGFKIPQNFNSPYIAGSFSDFWQRWHMTLSRWLRDYLYVSLGGNRKGKFKTYRNLMLTMLLGGLWHGANYTYVIWGALHGLFLVVERAFGLRKLKGTGAKLLWFLCVQLLVLVCWVFFRSENIPQAIRFLTCLFGFNFSRPQELDLLLVPGLALVPVLIIHLRSFIEEKFSFPRLTTWEKALLSGAMTYLILTTYGVSSEFIYFQF